MNKIMLMGRLTRDPEVRYSSGATPVSIARYSLAVRRQFAKAGEQDVDFINIVAFGKAAEFAEKYFRKGQQVAVVGRLQVNTWEDAEKVKHTSTEVVIEEQHFADSRGAGAGAGSSAGTPTATTPNEEVSTGFTPTNLEEDDDLPF